MVKLYFSPAACSMAPHIILNELELHYEPVRVNLKTKQYVGGDFLKINSKGQVPTLELETGEILTEVGVILQFLVDREPNARLMPKPGTMERYRCLEWINYVATEVHKGFGPLWKDFTPQDYKVKVTEILWKNFDFLSTHLERNAYLLPEYTAADAYLFTVLNWAHYLKLDLARWPKLQGYIETIRRRSAVQKTLLAEGLLKSS